jgi:hypothetical protein
MITPTFDDNEILPLPARRNRAASALRSLARDWEHEGVGQEDESETDLMVLLSGMVSVSDPATSDV